LQTQNNGKTYRLKFEWSDRNKAYVNHVYDLFNEWVISPPHPCPCPHSQGRGKGKKVRTSPKGNLVCNLGFQTISHQAFNPLAPRPAPGPGARAKLFIYENKKSIKESLIKNHLTERGLAYWFMDDGGKLDYNKNSKNKSIVLNTQSFLDSEVNQMAKELANKFNLSCEVRSNKLKKVIVIKSESYTKIRTLIDPYIVPEMSYKLPAFGPSDRKVFVL
ncbi:Intron-encoded endonuclease I-SceI, partial [Termitomyces sp. J132]